ncbi:MAG: hypothetical protein AB8G23_03745 [Myxococcota bacterium]
MTEPENAQNTDLDRIQAEAYAWPIAELDPVERMRALAAALPHVALDETRFDVPFEQLWSFIADLEGNTKRFEGGVTDLRILSRQGDTLQLEARTPPGFWMAFDAVLRPGWCLMKSRFGQVGMAARPEGPNACRFVHFEGSKRLGRLTRPYFAWNIRQDFRRLRGLL